MSSLTTHQPQPSGPPPEPAGHPDATSHRPRLTERMGDPGVPGLSLFGFALVLFGLQFIVSPDIRGAAVFGLLVAAIGETASGLLYILRGQTYQGSVLATFGIWLFGLFMMFVLGESNQLLTTESVAWFSFVLIVPVAYMAVPSFLHRNRPFSLAFVALIGVLFWLGLGELYESAAMLKVAGVLAWVAAVPIWFVAFRDVVQESGVHVPGVTGRGAGRAAATGPVSHS